MDLGAGWQQPAPQHPVPRRQGQGRPDHALLRLAERGSREAVGVDGRLREEDRRQAPRHSAQRQPVERAHVRADRLRGQSALEGLRAASRPLGTAAGDDADQGRQRDAPDALAQRRVRGLRHRGLGVRKPHAGRRARDAGDASVHVSPRRSPERPRARAGARHEPVSSSASSAGPTSTTRSRRSTRTTSSASTSTRSRTRSAGSTSRSRASARPATRGTTPRPATPQSGRPRTRAKPCGTR